MRLGIFSDIHANYEALSRVLEAYRTRAHRRLLLPRRHRRLRRLAERVLRPRPRHRRGAPSSATTTPRSPAAWTTRTTTRPRATRSTPTRRCSRPRTWRGCSSCPTSDKLDGDRRPPLPRLAGPPRGVRVHLRARAGARVPAHLGRARPPHAHRPLAPVQGVRAHPDSVEELPADRLRARARHASTSSASARSASRATTTTARATRSTTRDKKRFEFKRIEYDIETAADKVLRAKLERNFAHRLFIGV